MTTVSYVWNSGLHQLPGAAEYEDGQRQFPVSALPCISLSVFTCTFECSRITNMTITLHSRVCACVLSACRWTWPLRTPSTAVRKNSVPLRWVSGGSSSVCFGLCFLVVAFRVRGWAKGKGGRWGRGWGNIGAHGVSGKGKSMEVGVSCGLILEQGGDSTRRAMLWRSETQLFPPLTTLPFYSQPLYEGCLWETILFVNWKQLTYTIKSTISPIGLYGNFFTSRKCGVWYENIEV